MKLCLSLDCLCCVENEYGIDRGSVPWYAQAELDVVVDIVSMVEAAQFLSVAYVPRRADIQSMTREKAAQVADKQSRMRAASKQLQAGVAALRAPKQREDRLLADVGELLGSWRLTPWHDGLAAVVLAEDLFSSVKDAPTATVPLQQHVRMLLAC